MGIIRLFEGQLRAPRRSGRSTCSIAEDKILDAPESNAPHLDAPETIEVESETVCCDGGGGALGHPRVWLNMEGRGQIDCPYCDRRFVLKAGARAAAH